MACVPSTLVKWPINGKQNAHRSPMLPVGGPSSGNSEVTGSGALPGQPAPPTQSWTLTLCLGSVGIQEMGAAGCQHQAS